MEQIRRYDTVRLKRAHIVRDPQRGEIVVPAAHRLLVVEVYNSGVFELEDQEFDVHFSTYASELELVKPEESTCPSQQISGEAPEIRLYDTVRLRRDHVVKGREHEDVVVPAGHQLIVVEVYNSGAFELEDEALGVHFSTYASELELVTV